MDTREHYGPAPFGRDPRSIPLYVPAETDLPLWPTAWGWRGVLTVTLAGVIFFAGLMGAVVALAALLAP